MSNKAKATDMKEDGQPALVPKLRFPGFRDAEGWEEKRLGDEGEFFSSLTGKAGEDFDAGDARFVTYMNVFSNTFVDPKALRFVDVKEGESQNAVVSGDVFFTISSETPDEVGMSSVLLEELENCYLNSFCALFRFSENKRPNPVFTGYLLRQPLVRGYFSKKAQGSTRFNLSKDAFRSLPFFVPSRAEQQKIAECLSSVDELIAAQGRKLDALKTHKKGLMQQLFPREGETQPRLRFPEFQDAGEWATTTLGDAATFYNGRAYKQEELLESGKYTVLRVGNFFTSKTWYYSDLELDETKYCDYGDLLYAWSASFGPRVWRGEKTIYHYHIWKVVENQGIDRRFLFITLENETEKMKAESANGLGIMHITKGTIEGWETTFPTMPEQQRIADCLTSLDDLIAAQTQKLDALKTHKKGLMQQLFPSPEEVEA